MLQSTMYLIVWSVVVWKHWTSHGALQQKEMKAVSAQVLSCCVYDNPLPKSCSICVPIFYTYLTVGSIQLYYILLLQSSMDKYSLAIRQVHLKRFVINIAWGGFESGLNQCNMVNDSSVAYSLFLLLYLSSFE